MTCRIGDSYKYIVLGVVRFFAVVVVALFVLGMVQVVMVVQVVGQAMQNGKKQQSTPRAKSRSGRVVQ